MHRHGSGANRPSRFHRRFLRPMWLATSIAARSPLPLRRQDCMRCHRPRRPSRKANALKPRRLRARRAQSVFPAPTHQLPSTRPLSLPAGPPPQTRPRPKSRPLKKSLKVAAMDARAHLSAGRSRWMMDDALHTRASGCSNGAAACPHQRYSPPIAF